MSELPVLEQRFITGTSARGDGSRRSRDIVAAFPAYPQAGAEDNQDVLRSCKSAVEFPRAGRCRRSGDIELGHVEDFIADQIEKWSASTASVRFGPLQHFLARCLDEGELDTNPMARMWPPIVPERPLPVLGEVESARRLYDEGRRRPMAQ